MGTSRRECSGGRVTERPHLRVLDGGGVWRSVGPVFDRERATEGRSCPELLPALLPILERSATGRLKWRRDVRSLVLRPAVFELHVAVGSRRWRLYFAEPDEDPLALLALRLAEKPAGNNRALQNADIVCAAARLQAWRDHADTDIGCNLTSEED